MEAALSQVLVSRVRRLMCTSVPWINDLDCTGPQWTTSEAAARRFRDDHFFGYYRYRCPTTNKMAVVRYSYELLEEVSYQQGPEGVVINYTRLDRSARPNLSTRPATIRDLYGLLKLT